MSCYILRNRVPVPATPKEYIEWMKDNLQENCVSRTLIGNSKVSTVFVGFDLDFGTRELPTLFETMVFGGPLDGLGKRYSSWGEAEAGHRSVVSRLRNIEENNTPQ